MCACYVLNIIVLEFLWAGESLSGTVSCFPTADADEKSKHGKAGKSLGWYFQIHPLDLAMGNLLGLRGEWRVACLHLCLNMKCKYGLPPTKKGGKLLGEGWNRERRPSGPYLHSSLQRSGRSSLSVFAGVRSHPWTARGVGLSKTHLRAWKMVLWMLPSGAPAQKKCLFLYTGAYAHHLLLGICNLKLNHSGCLQRLYWNQF